MQGHCDAMNFPDYVYYYGRTPHDSQLLQQYRQHLARRGRTEDAVGLGDLARRVAGLPG